MRKGGLQYCEVCLLQQQPPPLWTSLFHGLEWKTDCSDVLRKQLKKKKKRDEQEGGVPEPANASLEKVRRLYNNPAAYVAKVGAAAGEWGRGSGGA